MSEREPVDDGDQGRVDVAAGPSKPEPADAFSRLGNATRLRTIRALAAADEPPTFTDLFEASEEDTSAGFAYHLRQLVGQYVEKDEETDRYRLTAAGRAVAHALRVGTYTDRVERDPESVGGNCPVCGAAGLTAGVADNLVTVACTGCDTALLTLPFPPTGTRDREVDDLLDGFDAYHRRRLALVGDGVCPDCAGKAHGELDGARPPKARSDSDSPADGSGDDVDGRSVEKTALRPVVAASCESCDFTVRAPVSLAVRDHPSVVAFYADHDTEPGPIWNLGDEWREGVLSTDPWAVRVTVTLDGERLRLFVGDGPTVVDAQRFEVESLDEG